MTGGRCTGKAWVFTYWNNDQQDCNTCNLKDTYASSCQVLDGLEPAHQCSALQQYLDYEEVPVPSKFRRKTWS